MSRPPLVRILFVALTGLVAGACAGDETPEDYSADTRAAMMTGCAEDDTDPNLVEVCACAYETAEEELPFDRFTTLENRLAQGETNLPADWVAIVRECIREVSADRR